jgi:Ankyrin repeat
MYALLYHHLGERAGVEFDKLTRLCWLLEGFGGDSAECFGLDLDLLAFPPRNATWNYPFECLESMVGRIRPWGAFLSHRHVDIDYRDTFGRSRLSGNCLWKDLRSIESVVVLLGCGANVAATDNDGCQPLHLALCITDIHTHSLNIGTYTPSQFHGIQLNIIRLLIVAGADIYAFDNHGWSPLDFAIHYSTDNVFFEALRHCCIASEDYIREHDRRKADWRRLHGAKRTAVDVQFIKSSSRTGLIKRRRRALDFCGIEF